MQRERETRRHHLHRQLIHLLQPQPRRSVVHQPAMHHRRSRRPATRCHHLRGTVRRRSPRLRSHHPLGPAAVAGGAWPSRRRTTCSGPSANHSDPLEAPYRAVLPEPRRRRRRRRHCRRSNSPLPRGLGGRHRRGLHRRLETQLARARALWAG